MVGAAAGAVLTSPEAMSWTALRMGDPRLLSLLAQGPRALGWAATPDRTSAR
jgi:hypothetical protein